MISGFMFDKQIISINMTPDKYNTFFTFCRFLSSKKRNNPEEYDRWYSFIKTTLPEDIFEEFEDIYISNAVYPSGAPQEFAFTKEKENIKKLRKAIELVYQNIIPEQFKQLSPVTKGQ